MATECSVLEGLAATLAPLSHSAILTGDRLEWMTRDVSGNAGDQGPESEVYMRSGQAYLVRRICLEDIQEVSGSGTSEWGDCSIDSLSSGATNIYSL